MGGVREPNTDPSISGCELGHLAISQDYKIPKDYKIKFTSGTDKK